MWCLEAYDGNLCAARHPAVVQTHQLCLFPYQPKSTAQELKQIYNHHHGAMKHSSKSEPNTDFLQVGDHLLQSWQKVCISVLAVLATLECSCSFLVPKQPALLKLPPVPLAIREETPEPLFLTIPTTFNR